MTKFLAVTALCLLAVSAFAATPAAINCKGNQSTTIGTITVASVVLTTPGDEVVIWTSDATLTGTPSVSDNGSGGSQTYVESTNSPFRAVATISGAFFIVENATSALNGATISATWTSPGAVIGIAYCEISNSVSGAAFDGNVGATCAACTSLTSGSLTTSNASDLLMFCASTSTTTGFGTVTPGGGYAIPSGASTTRNFCQTFAVSTIQTGVTTSAGWVTSGTEVISGFAGIEGASAATQTPPLFVIQP